MSVEKAQELLGDKLKKKDKQDRWGEFHKALKKMGLTDDVPDDLVKLLMTTKIPWFYLPTTAEIWQTFLQKILDHHQKPLVLPKDIDLTEPKTDQEVESFRKSVLSGVKGKMDGKGQSTVKGQQYFKLLEPLKKEILDGRLTSNFRLETLFKMKSPRLLNAFEVQGLTGEKTQNVKGKLEDERIEAEDDLFPEIGKRREEDKDEKIAPVLRPRYAALNFKGYPHGAAPRNDYGLSFMVLKDEVKKNATITAGDTFDAKHLGAFTLDEKGVDALLWSIAKSDLNFGGNLMEDYAALLKKDEYDPGETYFDAQIHQDLDIRRDVEAIYVSTAEMSLFNVDLKTVDELIKNLTGGVFVRQEG